VKAAAKKPTNASAEVFFFDREMVEKTLCRYENNNFALWLRNRVGAEAANEAIRRYRFGTSKHWKGATVFWQIDGEGRIRTGKIMLYDRRTGHRIKVNGQARINWVHTALKLTDFNLKQCLYGEHLLSGNNKPVAIVESEKTAIISKCFFTEEQRNAGLDLADYF
jgi:hypothetical protein